MLRPWAEYLLRYRDRMDETWENDPSNTHAAVIVESRPTFWLPLVIANFRDMLGPSWNIHHICPDQGVKFTVEDYNRLLTRPEFWQRFEEDWILIFQSDCVALRSLRDDECEFPMIGAPCGLLDPDRFTMNGGLSLRKRTVMAELATVAYRQGAEPEDVFFTRLLRRLKFAVPEVDQAAEFAVESLVPLSGRPFGIHGTDKYYHNDNAAQYLIERAMAVAA